jgi:hypothetical protein
MKAKPSLEGEIIAAGRRCGRGIRDSSPGKQAKLLGPGLARGGVKNSTLNFPLYVKCDMLESIYLWLLSAAQRTSYDPCVHTVLRLDISSPG